MDSEKIGKFIATNRKIKGLTQEQLAEKLGVTNKTVSRWENGNYMPDLSLLKPISENLEVTLNELLSGEKKIEEQSQKEWEENIMNTIDYSKNKIEIEHKKLSFALCMIGLVVIVFSLTIFESESSWCSIYSIIGIILLIIGINKAIKSKKRLFKVSISIVMFISILAIAVAADYISVQKNHKPPIYRYRTTTKLERTTKIAYYSLFYNVYRINANTQNEYYIIDSKKEYNIDTVPVSPFNRNKSGIDNLIKYKNKYIGNNSNDSNIISNLPLSKYGYVFEIDSKKLGLTIDYHTTDWYHNDNVSIEKSLLYNSLCIFALVDNVEYISYNFSGNSYKITRNTIEKGYPNYAEVVKNNEINKANFNKYIEEKMNDNEFVKSQFEKLF